MTNLIRILMGGLFLLMASPVYADAENSAIKVVFRYDDYGNRSKTEFEASLFETFKERSIPLLVGVIPFQDTGAPEPKPLVKEKAKLLKKAVEEGVVIPAVHGYFHLPLKWTEPEKLTEFKGRDHYDQLRMVAEGKELLEKAVDGPVEIFIPPYDSYDSTTLRVVEEAGYRTFSAGIYGPVSASSALEFLPETVNLIDLKKSVEAARRIRGIDTVIVVLFHPSDFYEADGEKPRLGLKEFNILLDWVLQQPDIRVVSPQEAASSAGPLDAGRFIQYKKFLTNDGLLPPLLRPAWKMGGYISPRTTRLLSIDIRWRLVFYYGVIFFMTACIGFALKQKAESISSAVVVLLRTTLMCLIIVGAFHLSGEIAPGYLKISGLTALTGLLLGTLLKGIIRRRDKKMKGRLAAQSC